MGRGSRQLYDVCRRSQSRLYLILDFGIDIHRVPQLLAIVLDQRVTDRLQVAGDDLIQFVERQVDAVIGDAVLGEVVGADPLAAVAGADQCSCRSSARFSCSSCLLSFVEPRLEDSQGLGEVLVLAFLVLALHDDARLEVRQADGRGGLVDVLPAGAAGVEDVLAIIVRLEVDFDVLRFGHHGHGGRRSVNPALGFGFRHPLHAVAAALVLQLAKDAFAFDRQR